METQLARRNTVTKSDTVSLSTTRSKPRRGIIYHSGTSGVVQELHNRHIEVIKEKERMNSLIIGYEKNIEKLKKEYDSNVKKAHELEYEVEQIRPEIESNVKRQIDYYYTLLEEGTDTRNIGLGWIVKTLQYLERKFPSPGRFPKFLEEDTVGCILRVAALEIRKEKLEKSLEAINKAKRKDSLKKLEGSTFVTPLPETLSIPVMAVIRQSNTKIESKR